MSVCDLPPFSLAGWGGVFLGLRVGFASEAWSAASLPCRAPGCPWYAPRGTSRPRGPAVVGRRAWPGEQATADLPR